MRGKKQNSVAWTSILDYYRQMRKMNELLLVKPGEILFFDTQENNSVHVLVSLGNGLFSGYRNSKLCPYLTDNIGITMAEQIGQFVGDKLKRYGTTLEKLKVYAAQINSSQIPHNSLNDVVERSLKEETLSLPEFMTKVLRESYEL